MIHDPHRLRQSLGKPPMARLVQAMRERLRLGRGLAGTLTLARLSEQERSAVDQFLHRRPSSGSQVIVRLSEVERILREGGICETLAEAVEAIVGPVEDERDARDSAARDWADLFASVVPLPERLSAYRPWLQQLRAKGLLKRLTAGRCDVAAKLLQEALAILGHLPQPIVPLAEFATRVTGDSHALDPGTPLSTLCLAALAQQHETKLKSTAECRRRLWELVGVVVDELSAPVLVLNLHADPETLIGKILSLAAGAGEPCYLTFRQLRGVSDNPFREMTGAVISVCENVSVVAAAARRLGARSLPLVCTAGQAASAAQLLLRQLREAGCGLRYHGDFDGPGIAIANLLHQRFGAEPWRMSVSDYSAAAAVSMGPRLCMRPVAAIWDAELAEQMWRRGYSVLEEGTLVELVEDLST